MKKSSLFLLGAAGLLLASCSNEDVVNPAAGDGNFNVTVKLPADVGTRALSDGLKAENLQVAVYDVTTGAPKLITTQKAFFGYSLETTVSLNLANGKNYKIAFFAQSGASETQTGGKQAYFFDPDNRKIVADYSMMNSADNIADLYDCFYNVYETGTITSASGGTTVYLYRPVAQINWGTNDYDEVTINHEDAFGENGEYVLTTMETKAYTEWDLLENNVIPESLSTVELSWNEFAAPTEYDFPVEGYDYVAMQFVFAPKDVTVYDLNLNISNGLNPNASAITNDDVFVHSAPVQANYRTNIYGSLLTNPNVFTVVKDPNWEKPDYDVDLTVWDGTTVSYPQKNSEGNYYIDEVSDLAGLAEMVSGGNSFEGETIILASDFDLGGKTFPGIGSASITPENIVGGAVFKGTFDGKGHTVNNFRIVGSTGTPAGFFPCVDSNGVVTDVVFNNVIIEGGASANGVNAATGVIGVLSNGATASNITVSGTVKGSNDVAGVVGKAVGGGTIKDCTNNATVNAAWQVGGIVGTCDANVSGCINNGNVTATGNSVGGVVAEQRCTGSVTGCTNNGDVKASADAYGVGGIVGWIRYFDSYGTTTKCNPITVSTNTNEGSVYGGWGAGGIVGRWSQGGTLTNNTNNAPSIYAGATGAAGILGMTSADTSLGSVDMALPVTGNVSTTPDSKITGVDTWTICYNPRGNAQVSNNTPSNYQIK